MRFTTGADAKVSVTYALQPALALWTPVAMDELYEIPYTQTERSSESDQGHATYANFRTLHVDVSVIIR